MTKKIQQKNGSGNIPDSEQKLKALFPIKVGKKEVKGVGAGEKPFLGPNVGFDLLAPSLVTA